MEKGSSIESTLTLKDQSSLEFLKKWNASHSPQLKLSLKHFKAFLPKNVNTVKVGDHWELIPIANGKYEEHLDSNRYQPLEDDLVSEGEIVLSKILQMFHKNAFLYPRFPPRGVALFLRALNDEYFDILMRVHAEFQINEPPQLPFWFTPAGFNGRLVIAKDASRVEYFRLFVPNEKRLNVDMEWLTEVAEDGHSMEVDIGYMARMEALAFGSETVNVEAVKWNQEVELEHGFNEVESLFYPFKKVKYLPFLEAFREAKKLDKLVHFIMLWGALDVRLNNYKISSKNNRCIYI